MAASDSDNDEDKDAHRQAAARRRPPAAGPPPRSNAENATDVELPERSVAGPASGTVLGTAEADAGSAGARALGPMHLLRHGAAALLLQARVSRQQVLGDSGG